jgi:hypothetical protein
MATTVYNTKNIVLQDGVEIELAPLKIKYLRQLMDNFDEVKNAQGDMEAIIALSKCARICMKQFRPKITETQEMLEEYVNLQNVYDILDITAGIKINDKSEEPVKKQAEKSGATWDDLDLASLESEVFLLGIWKDYEELETNLSMPELMATLESKRELEYQEKKFLAAIQGVDLDKNSGREKGQKEWEDMKARVFSGGATGDSNDVLALQGQNAAKAGFGIGMGLDYEDARDPSLMKN